MKARYAIGIAIVVLGASACAPSTASTGSKTTAPTAKPVTQTPTTPPTTPRTSKPVATIAGNALVHIGEDVPAGTYRVEKPVNGSCYWQKSSDSEGTDIIDNDMPPGGRPQVTLTRGQWFTSRDCTTWVKK